MSESQDRVDSWMEAICNTAVGFILSIPVNYVILWGMFGIDLLMSQNLMVSLLYTGVSLGRQYGLRRLFNGRTVWQAAKAWIYARPPRSYGGA